MIRRCSRSIALAAILLALTAGASAAFPKPHEATVSVGGAVATPATYTLRRLGALPQTSFTTTERWWGSRTHTDTGVSLEDLVAAAGPTLPTAKNAMLRVTVTVTGRWGWPVTLALGELDPNFGNHPAYLALTQDGRTLPAPELIVPGDSGPARTVPDVDQITVGVQSPTPTSPPSAGALTIQDGPVTRVLTAAQLAALPARTLSVTFLAGTSSQTHTEIGPTLAEVLWAARLPSGLNTWVAAVGSDGYVATVTPAEAFVGGRPLLVSLNEDGQPQAQPRLIVDGDVKGGRYVSGVDDLVVGQGAVPRPPWWRVA
jgi:hypothetical protein